MEAPAMLDHLQAISKEETSCTLVTSLGERVEVQSFLLAAISPYLAFLLSQAGSSPCISLPCSSSLLSSLITSLVNRQVFGGEQQQLASLLGVHKQIWTSEKKPDTPGCEQAFQFEFGKERREEPQTVSILGIKSQTSNKNEKIPKQLREGIGLKVEKGLANEVKANNINSQSITIHRVHKDKIKYEPVAKEKKETFGDASVEDDSQASTKHKITEVESSNKNIIVKGSNIKGVNSKSTLDSALCEICSKTFANRYILRAHMKNHEEKTDICDVCSKAFSNKQILKAHSLTHTQQKIQCQICFESVFALKNHMRSKHGENKLVTCSNCGIKIKEITRHERFCRMTEEERTAYKEGIKVKCEQCGKVLAHKFKLVRHVQTAHSKTRHLQCKFCDHKDNRSDNMKTHIKNNHKNQ